jgi:hypothetical protein
MKQFHITNFPKFIVHADGIMRNDPEFVKLSKDGVWPYHMVMHIDGFASANIGDPGRGFLLNDEEYTWFVLKWA